MAIGHDAFAVIGGTIRSMDKVAIARGMASDLYAFPAIGVPQHSPIGPEIDRSVVYSVGRTESAFDQSDASPAKAVGIMQVTPAAGRDSAKRFGVAYDRSDPPRLPVNVPVPSAG
jgi:soluble lytic murein transglycosylase